jgi:hypothetical protein
MPRFCSFVVRGALLLVACLFATSVIQSAEPLTIRVDLIDETGQPCEDAEVHVVGTYQWHYLIHATPGSVSLSHKGEGRYEGSFDQYPHPLLHHNEVILVVLRLGVARGELRDDIDPTTVLNLLVGGAFVYSRSEAGLPPEERARLLVDTVLRGLHT